MGAKERKLIVDYIKNAPGNCRIFRSNAGLGWAGNIVKKSGDTVTLKSARPLHGLPKGFPDSFGFESVQITEDMTGRTVAIFKCVEFKTGRLQLTNEQKLFRDMVEKFGGIFEIVRDG